MTKVADKIAEVSQLTPTVSAVSGSSELDAHSFLQTFEGILLKNLFSILNDLQSSFAEGYTIADFHASCRPQRLPLQWLHNSKVLKIYILYVKDCSECLLFTYAIQQYYSGELNHYTVEPGI